MKLSTNSFFRAASRLQGSNHETVRVPLLHPSSGIRTGRLCTAPATAVMALRSAPTAMFRISIGGWCANFCCTPVLRRRPLLPKVIRYASAGLSGYPGGLLLVAAAFNERLSGPSVCGTRRNRQPNASAVPAASPAAFLEPAQLLEGLPNLLGMWARAIFTP